MHLLQNICSQKKKKTHTVWSSTFFSSHCLSASKPGLCVLLEPSLSPFLIQLLTPVYAIVLSEDSRGCKLYLEATSTVEKKKKRAITQGRSLCIFQEKPRRKMKIEKSSTLCWDAEQMILSFGERSSGGRGIGYTLSCVSHSIPLPEGNYV